MNPNVCSNAAVVDLFAGAGGLGLGAEMAGASLRLSIEIDAYACETLRANRTDGTHRVLEDDIVEVTGRRLRREAGLGARDPLVVVGGAPCQPFSKAAYWTESGDDAAYRRARSSGISGLVRPAAPTEPRSDSRRTLVEHFTRLVVESKADAFVFENVLAITHPRNRPMLDDLVRELGMAGHEIQVMKVNAAAFGVAQRRERVFVLGSKAGLPQPPAATHQNSGDKPQRAMEHLLPVVTAKEVCAPFSPARYAEPEEVVAGRWAEHLRTVPPGWNYKAHTAWGGHTEPTFVTETRFWNFLLKLHPDLPSWTLAASPGPWTGPFHWNSRRLRVPEMAALQGFPADYRFVGSRRERVRQIGNAVAPPVAMHMVGAVLETLAASGKPTARQAS